MSGRLSPLRKWCDAAHGRARTVAPREYDAKLPGQGVAFLCLRLFLGPRFRRQLQHGGLLAFAQEYQKKHLPVGKFERAMVHMRLLATEQANNRLLVLWRHGSV